LKVVHVIVGLNIGGAELMLFRLIKSHSKDVINHQVISLTSLGSLGPELIKNNIPVYSLNMKKNPLHLFFSISKLRKLFKKLKPDIIHSWMYHSDLLAGLAAYGIGFKRIVWCIRSTDISKGENKLTLLVRKLCSILSYHIPAKIICAAEASKIEHILVGYDKSKIEVIPNGFNIKSFTKSQKTQISLRHDLGISEDQKVIMSIGRYCNEKDHETFLKAAIYLCDSHEKICFVLIGRNILPTNSKLTSIVDSTKYKDKFYFIGQRDDVPNCLDSADIFCLHSTSEGFPNVLGEAMLSGKPCIATDVGDASFILKKTNWIVEPKDPIRLAKKISNMLSLDEIDRINLGKENKERIKENFSMSFISNKYLKLYKGLYISGDSLETNKGL
jgi:glycosyltransferase involved in cell wall biosynthesis